MALAADEFFETLSLEEQQALIRGIGKRASEAKTNPTKFFNFVMREQTTRVAIKAAPHQQLVIEFVMFYPRCLIRMPIGFAKTFTLGCLALFELGSNVTQRGAVVSSVSDQAQKVVKVVSDIIDGTASDSYFALKQVFPDLKPGEPWSTQSISVDRPGGIPDDSLVALGINTKMSQGSRWGWILVDDLLNDENTATPESRKEVYLRLLSAIESRLDLKGGRFVMTQVPWAIDDATYLLEDPKGMAIPSLTMDVDGNIWFMNADDFDSELIRPSKLEQEKGPDGKEREVLRLTAHDSPEYCPALKHLSVEERMATLPEGWVDEKDEVPLWPEHMDTDKIEEKKRAHRTSMPIYMRNYKMKVRDEASARFKQQWIEQCKRLGRDRKVFGFVDSWKDGNAFTGIDIATATDPSKKSHKSAVFTYAVIDDVEGKEFQPLKIDIGQYEGEELIEIIADHHNRFDSLCSVENNAAQDLLRQWAKKLHKTLPLRGKPTGKNKWSSEFGLEAIFWEFQGGAWRVPNDADGNVHEHVQEWLDAMLFFDPKQHTPDVLMANWVARNLARDCGALNLVPRKQRGRQVSRVAASIRVR